jgi:hypothetical protein
MLMNLFLGSNSSSAMSSYMEVMQKIFNWAEEGKQRGGRANLNEHLRKTYECEGGRGVIEEYIRLRNDQ